MKTVHGTLLLAVLACAPAPVRAAHSCTILSAPTLDFGLYTAAGSDRDAEGSLLFSCTPDVLLGLSVPYRVSLGTGGSGTYTPRQLRAGGYALNYNLFRDAPRTEIWGDGSGSSVTVTGGCTGPCTVTVFGRIPAGQLTPAASYQDTVEVILDF
jgi:spore coat protein U-like protein